MASRDGAWADEDDKQRRMGDPASVLSEEGTGVAEGAKYVVS